MTREYKVGAMKKLLLMVTAISLIGCAGGPTFSDYSKSLPPPKQGEGRIWFYRPQKILGSGVQPAVALNGQKVGTAKPGGFFYADRPAGDYEVKCTTEWAHKCRVMLAPQMSKYVRLSLYPGFFVGHVVPREEVDSATALGELQELHAN